MAEAGQKNSAVCAKNWNQYHPLSAPGSGKGFAVHPDTEKIFEKIFPTCHSILDLDTWDWVLGVCVAQSGPENFPDTLRLWKNNPGLPGFLPELARLELNLYQMGSHKIETPSEIEQLCVNPTLQLFQLSWKNLPSILHSQRDAPTVPPEPGEELVLVWRHPESGEAKAQAATDEDLLALKIVMEDIKPEEIGPTGKAPLGAVDAVIDRSVEKGILLQPRPRLRRDPAYFPIGKVTQDLFLSSPLFTLQWHITQACDLHCRHCYDRSDRPPLELDRAICILDDLRAFCRRRYVKGQISYTGGNPLLYPHFVELYREAAERGFSIAILGNPSPREQIEELLAIQRPAYFQVSLEGLADHDNAIRGPGHFEKVIEFLKVLRDLRIYSMVMLTLTKDNLDQILPLAEILRDWTDSFTFNRLSQVGEGARLQLPPPDVYTAFLEDYLKAVEKNPILALKDNLINILFHQKGTNLFGGCTGYGCGAAFNFLAVLPDGEVHACRKFPSYLGNVLEKTLSEIYESEVADRYRAGSEACRSCRIRPVCGGCLAVVHGQGRDIFVERDPYCFMEAS